MHMSVVFPIAGAGHLRQNTLMDLGSAFAQMFMSSTFLLDKAWAYHKLMRVKGTQNIPSQLRG